MKSDEDVKVSFLALHSYPMVDDRYSIYLVEKAGYFYRACPSSTAAEEA
jgi:hypothetical protein